MAGLIVAVLFGAWFLLGAVLTLLFGESALRRKRLSLLDRLVLSRRRSVADEAAEWLCNQQRGHS
jgi:hypothetical protein